MNHFNFQKVLDSLSNDPDEISGFGIAVTFLNCLANAIIVGLNFGLMVLSSQAFGA